ncbi:MAG: hypothetical protein DMG07_03570 [Acidobacteria bacterium]|nr:MAG: hypothetical protein DMG07_03570 [Acidobacteriota bacterium]
MEIRTPGGPVTGRLMNAELRTRSSGPGATVQVVEVVVFTPAGEARIVELQSAGGLRLAEPGLAADLARYLELLDTAHRRDVRRLRIHTLGAGERQLYVSYTSESPVWKTTYRVVLDPKQKPLLQGWAIVDNTTPMDWMDVTLSLVAGAPVSFVQNLSQPLYARRPVVPLPEGVQVTPQLHEATLAEQGGRTAVSGRVVDPTGAPVPGAMVSAYSQDGALVRQAVTGADGRYRVELGPGTYRIAAVIPGFRTAEYSGIETHAGRTTALDFSLELGQVTEKVEVTSDELKESSTLSRNMRMAKAPAAPPAPGLGGMGAGVIGGRLGEVMRQQAPETAHAQALGEQFEYKLRQPATIRRNESALLPIIHAEVEGEKVSLYSESAGGRPRLAVWVKNSSGLTLDRGSFTVIDTNAGWSKPSSRGRAAC